MTKTFKSFKKIFLYGIWAKKGPQTNPRSSQRTSNAPPLRNKNKLCEANKKYSFVSGAPGDENKSHAGGRENIFFGKLEEKNIVENL